MVYKIYVELNKISYILYQISYLENKLSYIGYKISYILIQISLFKQYFIEKTSCTTYIYAYIHTFVVHDLIESLKLI